MAPNVRLSKISVALILHSAALLVSYSAMAQFGQPGVKLTGTTTTLSSAQGTSTALSADGGTAVVGGPNDNGDVGAAWVFTRSAGVWTQQGGKLVGTGAVGAPQEGGSISLSADGNTALVGGRSDDSETGAVWIFVRSAGAWAQQGSKLVGG